MIRIVVQVADASMAANVGGPVQTWCRTFDVEAPDLEAFMQPDGNAYREKHVVGVEFLPLPEPPKED
jgi:hypothetical protein